MYKNLIYFYNLYYLYYKTFQMKFKNNNYLNFLLITLFLFSCTSKPDPFLITKKSVGLLTDSTLVKDLQLVFPNDSISKFISGDEFLGDNNIIRIFDKESKKILLELNPKESLDSLTTIQNIRIMDNRYRTNNSLNKICDFGCISRNYNVSNIQNTIKNLIISVDEINAYFTIDKNELPENLRSDMNLKIEESSIPKSAKIKDFFIQWL